MFKKMFTFKNIQIFSKKETERKEKNKWVNIKRKP
jgi:hypothetical protein